MPCLGAREIVAVTAALESGWVSTASPEVERFERAFAARLGAPQAVATVSGTEALHVALLAAGVGPGDEVLMPALTFVAPANAELQRLDSPQKRQAFLAEHTADLETTLAPPTLIAFVEPQRGPDGTPRLTQGRPAPRLRSVGGVLFGMALMVFGLLPVARRWRLENE